MWLPFRETRTYPHASETLRARDKLRRSGLRVEEVVTDVDLAARHAQLLPTDGWIGGQRPDLAGKPHLLHLWAMWCTQCERDVPRLRQLRSAAWFCRIATI